jgi:hypothetical protein
MVGVKENAWREMEMIVYGIQREEIARNLEIIGPNMRN